VLCCRPSKVELKRGDSSGIINQVSIGKNLKISSPSYSSP
jgi:hypothetical protein